MATIDPKRKRDADERKPDTEGLSEATGETGDADSAKPPTGETGDADSAKVESTSADSDTDDELDGTTIR